VLLAIVAVVAVCAALEALTLFRMRGDLQAGRRSLESARRSLVAGNVDAAAADFSRAGIDFGSAAHAGHGPLGDAGALIPGLGNSLDVARAIAEAGGDLSAAGIDLTEAFGQLPGGIDDLAPEAGRLPLDAYASILPALARAADDTTAASAALDRAPTSFTIDPALNGLWDAQLATDQASDALTAARQLVAGLPSFAGEGRERRYLVVAQNPAELRGTGGIWGAFAILSFRDGRVKISGTAPIQDLADPAQGDVPDPSEEYARNYDQFGGAASWHNLNMTPDFPSAAQAALANYRVGQRQRLDGVIAVDPYAFRAMLTVTGAVAVPEIGFSLNADNVVDLTTNRAYSLFPTAPARKEVLGAVAAGVLERFLGIDGRAIPRLRALGDAVGGGHLLVYSTDDVFEDGLVSAGAAGRFDAPPGSDVAGVTVNNASASKVDFYAVRHVSYDVRLGGQHDAVADLTARIRNEAPTSGEPRYVIGPFVEDAKPGAQLPLITEWCHEPCELTGARRDGHDVTVAPGTENGVDWYRDYRTIPAGGTGSFGISTHTTGVWEGNSSGGTYRLTFYGQPTIRPTTLDLSITAPEGTRIAWTSTPMAVDGQTATWSGDPGAVMTIEVRFRAPVPLRIERDATRPVFGD
jgi:Protein of unknown function (DUF4012)